MKRILCICMFILVICSCTKDKKISDKVPIDSISIKNNTIIMYKGEQVKLMPLVLPLNANYQSIEYTSADLSIATVTSTGIVQGISEGRTLITARVNGKSASAQIEVKGDFKISDKYVGMWECYQVGLLASDGSEYNEDIIKTQFWPDATASEQEESIINLRKIYKYEIKTPNIINLNLQVTYEDGSDGYYPAPGLLGYKRGNKHIFLAHFDFSEINLGDWNVEDYQKQEITIHTDNTLSVLCIVSGYKLIYHLKLNK